MANTGFGKGFAQTLTKALLGQYEQEDEAKTSAAYRAFRGLESYRDRELRKGLSESQIQSREDIAGLGREQRLGFEEARKERHKERMVAAERRYRVSQDKEKKGRVLQDQLTLIQKEIMDALLPSEKTGKINWDEVKRLQTVQHKIVSELGVIGQSAVPFNFEMPQRKGLGDINALLSNPNLFIPAQTRPDPKIQAEQKVADIISEKINTFGVGSQQQGGQLMIDANGNKAIVFPDGTFKEVQ